VDHSIDASKTLLHHLMGDADIRRLAMKPSRAAAARGTSSAVPYEDVE